MLPGYFCWRPWWFRYGIALLTVALATAGVAGAVAVFDLPTFLLYIAAIALSVGYGGMGPGLAAMALALFVSYYVFLPPSFRFTSETSPLPLVVYYLGTVVLSGLVARRRLSAVNRCRVEGGPMTPDEE